MLTREPHEVRLVVEAGKVAEFRAATGLAPAPDCPWAPPTFPVVVEHWNATYASYLSDAGIDLATVLHGEERIDYPNGPLRVGDDLRGVVSIVGDERTEGRSGPLRLVTFRLELNRPSGELVVVVERVLVVLDGGS